jgi:hypothetical protein
MFSAVSSFSSQTVKCSSNITESRMPLAFFDGDKTGYGFLIIFDLIIFFFSRRLSVRFKWGVRLHVPHSNHSALYDVGQHRFHSAFTRERLSELATP